MKNNISNTMKPYLKASSLYKVDEISDADLLKAIQKEIITQQTDDENVVEDLQCALVVVMFYE